MLRDHERIAHVVGSSCTGESSAKFRELGMSGCVTCVAVPRFQLLHLNRGHLPPSLSLSIWLQSTCSEAMFPARNKANAFPEICPIVQSKCPTWVTASKKYIPFLLSARMCSESSGASDKRRTTKKVEPNSGQLWRISVKYKIDFRYCFLVLWICELNNQTDRVLQPWPGTVCKIQFLSRSSGPNWPTAEVWYRGLSEPVWAEDIWSLSSSACDPSQQHGAVKLLF